MGRLGPISAEEMERVVVFGTLLALGLGLAAVGVPPVKAFLLCVLALLAALFLNPYQRWRHRRLPGPPYRPLVGNLPEIMAVGSHAFFDECRRAYGPVFVAWFGARPWVVVADAELGRRANYRLVNRPSAFANPLARGEALHAAKEGLFLARDGTWGMLRRVWQPAFRPAALEGYAPLMATEARGLVRRLRGVAAAEPGGGLTDVWRDIGAMTMSVVGSTAYGVDFRLLSSSNDDDTPSSSDTTTTTSSDDDDGDGDDVRPGADARPRRRRARAPADAADAAAAAAGALPELRGVARNGAGLVRAAADMFSASEISNATRYLVAAHLMPVLVPAIRLLAALLPDARYRRLVRARETLRRCSQALIDETRAAQRAAAAAMAGGDPHAPAAGGAPLKAGAGANADAGCGAAGAAPGSFLSLLLAARDPGGRALSDRQMAAQCNVFTLAGFETTSNALAYAIYCLSASPAAQARLLAELDALDGPPGRAVAVADLPRLPYAAAVVDEALRLFPPGASTMREARGGLELGGHRVPDGTTVLVASYSLHRDARYWPKAGDFLPERWLKGYEHLAPTTPHAYLPFGAGARMCIGHRFALQEARLTLAALYREFTFELAPGQVPLRVRTGITMAPEAGVVVRVVPRRRDASGRPVAAAAPAPTPAPAPAPVAAMPVAAVPVAAVA